MEVTYNKKGKASIHLLIKMSDHLSTFEGFEVFDLLCPLQSQCLLKQGNCLPPVFQLGWIFLYIQLQTPVPQETALPLNLMQNSYK